MKLILRYALIIAGVWAVYVAKVWASRTGFPLLTAAGYVLIIVAVLGLLAYALKPALRTTPPRKFVAPAFLLLVFGIAAIAFDGEKKVRTNSVQATNTVEPLTTPPKDIAGITLDGEKKVRTNSVPMTNVVESSTAASSDKELSAREKDHLAGIINQYKDSIRTGEGMSKLWEDKLKELLENKWKENPGKQEVDMFYIPIINAFTNAYKGNCYRFKELINRTNWIENNEAQKKFKNGLEVYLYQCNVILQTMQLTSEVLKSKSEKIPEETMGDRWLAVTKTYKSKLSEAQKLDVQVRQLFISALITLGMSSDLESY